MEYLTVLKTIGSIFMTSLFTWILLAGYFMMAQHFSRMVFIVGHYAISIIATLIFFTLLYKYFFHFSPFWTMVSAMISLFIIEIIVFSLFYKGELWFLNFVDWMVPVFLISTTIYALGVYILS